MSEVLQGSFLVDKNGIRIEIVDVAARNGLNQLGQEVHSDAYKNQIVNAVLAAVPNGQVATGSFTANGSIDGME